MRQTFDISFGCAPESVAKVRAALFAELQNIGRRGIGEPYLGKVKEQLRRQHELNLRDNTWWLNTLRDAYDNGDSFAEITDTAAVSLRVTSADIRAAAQRSFDTKRYTQVILRPSAAAAPHSAQ